ncbi:MAG TPA: hypothetical protein ENI92_08620, partial [Bacteroidetes bacterium]|nr:hypothetical protein [Bacteroidota bacterium]
MHGHGYSHRVCPPGSRTPCDPEHRREEETRGTGSLNPGKPRIGPWLLCLAVVIADQVVKRIVVSTMQLHQSIPVLGDVVRLTYIHNDGLVFGIDIPSSKLLGWLIAHGVVSLIAAIAVFYLLLKMHNDP